jgi:hypothetical protein
MSISLFGRSGAVPAWKQMENWHAKQKQFAADFEANNTNLVSALSDTFMSTNDGLFEITVRKAVAAAQQRAAYRASLNRVDLSV